jgi:hypothetical protein
MLAIPDRSGLVASRCGANMQKESVAAVIGNHGLAEID